MKKKLLASALGFIGIVVAYWLAMAFIRNPEIRQLPYYTLRTLLRITLTLAISLVWGISFGILASTSRIASLILIPIVDLLQSIPILGYFPAAILFLISVFRGSQLAIELSAILLLFTSMAWAIFFGVVGAVKSIPPNVAESCQTFGITGYRYTRHVILPAITPAVVAAATLAWCDGWFFMIAAEYIQYAGRAYFVPGLGMYLAKASYVYNDLRLAVVLLCLITALVLYINSLTWHNLMDRATRGTYKPILKMDLSGMGQLGIFRSMGVRRWLHVGDRIHWPRSIAAASQRLRRYTKLEKAIALVLALSMVIFGALVAARRLPSLDAIRQGFSSPPAEELGKLPKYIALTMARLGAAYGISLVLALALGVLAAENRKFAAIFYPLYDIGQAVPILALFPVLYRVLTGAFGPSVGLELTAISVLVLDMVWYMFLNIVSAVKNIPSEMNEVGRLFGLKGLKKVTQLVVPCILPAIVTGSILSWGTGWNTIIYSEYMPYESTGKPFALAGLGSYLCKAGYEYGNTVLLVFLLSIMATIVLMMEAFVWRRLLRKFEKRRMEV